MNQAYPISVDDPAADCPVATEMLGQLIASEAETLPSLLEAIPEATRARLAVYLYGRSHTTNSASASRRPANGVL